MAAQARSRVVRNGEIAARLAAWRAREAQASLEEFHGSRGSGYELSLEQVEALLKDAWLAGSIERLRALLNRSGDRWVKGMRKCRATFG